MSVEKSPVEPNATQLLQAQVNSLAEIADMQRQQIKALEQIKRNAGGLTGVKIQDFNMPFMNLVGIMVKIALASIPAAIVLTIIYFIIAFIIVTVFGGIGLLSTFM
ncbi:MAG: hypothetical protein DHS20C20_31620 [Ardenticatenaceae bacterium]|nr:MAG: hypothetical protein DHS20C20_31620 [Ardenticatenaceae bacterium]